MKPETVASEPFRANVRRQRLVCVVGDLVSGSARRAENPVAAFAVDLARDRNEHAQGPFEIHGVSALAVRSSDRECCRRRLRVEPRELLGLFRWNAGDRGGPLWRERRDASLEVVEAVRPPADEVPIPETLSKHLAEDRERERRVGRRAGLEPQICCLRLEGRSRVDNSQLSAGPRRVPHKAPIGRRRSRRMLTPQDDDVRRTRSHFWEGRSETEREGAGDELRTVRT